MSRFGLTSVITAVAVALMAIAASAQQPPPATGPNNPVLPRSENKSDKTIVINPTLDECRRPWDATMRWTHEQFEAFCTALLKSK